MRENEVTDQDRSSVAHDLAVNEHTQRLQPRNLRSIVFNGWTFYIAFDHIIRRHWDLYGPNPGTPIDRAQFFNDKEEFFQWVAAQAYFVLTDYGTRSYYWFADQNDWNKRGYAIIQNSVKWRLVIDAVSKVVYTCFPEGHQ